MVKRVIVVFGITLLVQSLSYAASVGLGNVPPLPEDTRLNTAERKFGYRGKIGGFMLMPSRYGVYGDEDTYYEAGADRASIKMMYEKKDEGFCGTYLIIMGDISRYKTMSFMLKGQNGGETFEIGLNDTVSNKREDAVMVGSIYRYLPGGVTTEWQEAEIPLGDFYGPDLSRVYSIIFLFNEPGKGAFWVDEVKFYEDSLVDREEQLCKEGYLLLDDFDHSDLNLLGRKTGAYKKLPSVCTVSRTSEGHWGNAGRSLKLAYTKDVTGWCGYYSLLNQVDGAYYDLTPFDAVSFIVKGEQGGETFEIGVADRNWLIIGDSLKAGTIENYLPGGITTEWQEVKIPLRDFGLLDFSEMGSFVINFHKKGQSTIYIDELKFHLKRNKVESRE